MHWEIFEDEETAPEELMQKEREQLEACSPCSQPRLRFYRWRGNCATYGYFINPSELLTPYAFEVAQINLARRPTGGGLIFHDFDLAFSILLPASHPAYSINPLTNYANVNGWVKNALKKFKVEAQFIRQNDRCGECHLCMAKPTIYDLIINGKKVGGAAQRRTKNGLLHQGSLSLFLPSHDWLSQMLVGGTHLAEQILANSFPLFEQHLSEKGKTQQKQHLKECLIDVICS